MVAKASTSSLVRKWASRRKPAMSTRRVAAYTTTPPRAASGNASSAGPRNSSVATRTSSAVSAATWLRPPLETITAVRLPLLLTGKPCSRPADTLAAPRASSSWLALIGGSSRVANARPVSTLSVKPTAAIPVAASATWTRSSAATSGTFGTGRPRGTSPTTARPRRSAPMSATTMAAATMTISTHGQRGRIARPVSSRITTVLLRIRVG